MTSPTKKLIIDIVSLVIAIAGTILAVANEIKDIPGLPGWLSDKWPLVLAAATIVHRVGGVIMSWIAKNNGVPSLVFACLFLSSCSMTQDQKDTWSVVGKTVASKALDIGKDMAINWALNKAGASKGDWLWSIAEHVRTVQTPDATPAQVEKAVREAAPVAPGVASQLANLFAGSNGAPEQKVAQIAKGIEAAAARAK